MSDISIFTDGAYKNNKAGYGIIIITPDKPIINLSGRFKIEPITNQRAELYAIYMGLKYFYKNRDKYNTKNITIYSDSEYSLKCITIWYKKWNENNWKTTDNKCVKNIDLIKSILKYKNKLIANYYTIIFKHVKSHQKNNDVFEIKYNNLADTLATNGMNS